MRKYQKTHRKPKRAKAGVATGVALALTAQNIWNLGRWIGETFRIPTDKIPRPLLEIINDYALKGAKLSGKYVIEKTKDSIIFTVKEINKAMKESVEKDARNAINNAVEDYDMIAEAYPKPKSKPQRARKYKFKKRPLIATVRRRKRTKKDKKGRTKKSKKTKKYTYAQRRLENAEQRLAIAKGINKKNVRKPLKLGDLNPDLLELIRDKLQED